MVWVVRRLRGGDRWCARPKDGGVEDTLFALNGDELAEYIREAGQLRERTFPPAFPAPGDGKSER
jgi:hypothetical protein